MTYSKTVFSFIHSNSPELISQFIIIDRILDCYCTCNVFPEPTFQIKFTICQSLSLHWNKTNYDYSNSCSFFAIFNWFTEENINDTRQKSNWIEILLNYDQKYQMHWLGHSVQSWENGIETSKINRSWEKYWPIFLSVMIKLIQNDAN